MRVFVFGLGYSAGAAVRAMGAPYASTTRETFAADLTDALADVTHVIVSVPPDADGDPVLRHHRAALLAAPALEWLCYYSTVGVYGDFGGTWVDEDAATQPVNERSRLRVVVEDQWRAFARQRRLPLMILRLAGIYGPDRSAFDKLRSGEARRIVKPGQVFNRIHVADIGRVTALGAARRLDGTFNLADDEPAPPQDVVAYAAELIGTPPPREVPFADAQMTPMARSFYADNKRVSNARIKQALGIELLYPSYRDGLRAILKDEA